MCVLAGCRSVLYGFRMSEGSIKIPHPRLSRSSPLWRRETAAEGSTAPIEQPASDGRCAAIWKPCLFTLPKVHIPRSPLLCLTPIHSTLPLRTSFKPHAGFLSHTSFGIVPPPISVCPNHSVQCGELLQEETSQY